MVFLAKSTSRCSFSINIPHPLPWGISGWAPALRYYLFCKKLHLKCLSVFWMRVCLDNCSVICTVTLRYVLHQTKCKLQNSKCKWVKCNNFPTLKKTETDGSYNKNWFFHCTDELSLNLTCLLLVCWNLLSVWHDNLSNN